MPELISVVVPVYNVDKYLRECLESIVDQTYNNLEIICINDGSTDNSLDILREYSRRDTRIKIIDKDNGGLSSARNEGINNSKADLIAFIDSDDIISKKYIEILYNLIKSYNADIAECGFKSFKDKEYRDFQDEEKTTLEMFSGVEKSYKLYDKDYVRTVVAWNKLYNKKLFNDVEYTYGKIHEDESTTYKLLYNSNKIVTTNEILYYYRHNPNSITKSKFNLKALDYLDAIQERLDFYKNKNEKELYALTLYTYHTGLVNLYYKCEKYIDGHVDIKNNLKIEHKKIFDEIISNKYLTFGLKTKAVIKNYFPKLYFNIFIKTRI